VREWKNLENGRERYSFSGPGGALLLFVQTVCFVYGICMYGVCEVPGS